MSIRARPEASPTFTTHNPMLWPTSSFPRTSRKSSSRDTSSCWAWKMSWFHSWPRERSTTISWAAKAEWAQSITTPTLMNSSTKGPLVAQILWGVRPQIRRIYQQSKTWQLELLEEFREIRKIQKDAISFTLMKKRKSCIGCGSSWKWNRLFIISTSTWWAMFRRASGQQRPCKRQNREKVARTTWPVPIFLTVRCT